MPAQDTVTHERNTEINSYASEHSERFKARNFEKGARRATTRCFDAKEDVSRKPPCGGTHFLVPSHYLYTITDMHVECIQMHAAVCMPRVRMHHGMDV